MAISKSDLEIILLTRKKVYEFEEQIGRDDLVHLFWMLNMIESDTRYNEKVDTRKVNRWLGFIHGTLIALTNCTVEELRSICREKN